MGPGRELQPDESESEIERRWPAPAHPTGSLLLFFASSLSYSCLFKLLPYRFISLTSKLEISQDQTTG